MLLKVKYIISYGRVLFYPVNKQSRCLCRMMKRKSFTHPQMKELQASGFDVEIIAPPLDDLEKPEKIQFQPPLSEDLPPEKYSDKPIENTNTPNNQETEPCQNTLSHQKT